MRWLALLLLVFPSVANAQVVGVVCTSPDGLVYQGTGVVESFMQVEVAGRVLRYGKVITAEHVIVAAGKVEIVMPGGARAPASIMAVNHNLDLALLNVDDFPARIAVIKMATRANRGNKVTARNFAGQAVSGVISEVYPNAYIANMGVSVKGRVISMTTPIVPGYSGGPLLNDAGELVGISLASGPVNYGVCVSEVKGFIYAARLAQTEQIEQRIRELRK